MDDAMSVRDVCELHNDASALKQQWNPDLYEKQLEQQHSLARARKAQFIVHPAGSFRLLSAVLPQLVHNVTMMDRIANDMASPVRVLPMGPHGSQATVVDIMPPYPLFGQDSLPFVLTWHLPVASAISSDVSEPGRYLINVTMVPPFASTVVDQLDLEIFLPEGAVAIETVMPPFEVDDVALDLSHVVWGLGQPRVVIRKRLLVASVHTQPVSIRFLVQHNVWARPVLVSILIGVALLLMEGVIRICGQHHLNENRCGDADLAVQQTHAEFESEFVDNGCADAVGPHRSTFVR
jgi:hypothetical protein